nr:unnamed protein product [Rotaria sp. Silwood1]CAF4794951.1 unnamed protein product [Rotaria sp. Silwood1]
MEKGDIEIFLYKTVVDEVFDPAKEIDKETAKAKSGEDFEVEDDFVEEIPIEDFEDPSTFISRALAPAKLLDIDIDNENKVAKIYSEEDQIRLIIGKEGQNIKLASKLTGFQIDVDRLQNEEKEEDADDNEDEDIDSDEISDEETTETVETEEVKSEEVSTEEETPAEDTDKKEEAVNESEDK